MKTIFDQSTRDEMIRRIQAIDEHSSARWGKMSVSQMLKHCSQWDEMAQGKTRYRQSLIGRLFGKMALRDMLKDEKMKRNLPTVPSFVIRGSSDVETEKKKWIQLMHQYADYPTDGFIHPFFGAISKENTGYLVYKHADHHLRQFGV